MGVDLFAGTPVTDFATSLAWYERLLGAEPSFLPHDTEAVWEVDEHRYVYIVQRPERAGGATNLLFVADLGPRLTAISSRGLEPVSEETYDNGVRKVVFEDPDGNELAFGGGPGD